VELPKKSTFVTSIAVNANRTPYIFFRIKGRLLIAGLLIFGAGLAARGQEADLEPFLESESESEDQAELTEYLQSLQEKPLDINKASAEQLQSLPWISPSLALAIITYRNAHGPFASLEALLNLSGVDLELLENIRPYLRAGRKLRIPPIRLKGRHRFFQKIEKGKGYTDGTYPGSRDKIYNRITCSIGDNLRLGGALEKDPGEKNMDDLVLGYGKIDLPSWNSQILVGNYAVEAGQGLVCWGPFGSAAGYDPIVRGKQRIRGIQPYSSAQENAALLGAAVCSQIGRFEINGFYSHTLLDASVENDSISSLPNTGLHRTARELQQRDALGEILVGATAIWRCRPGLNLGIACQSSRYEKPLMEKEDLYQRYAFVGNENSVWGVNFDYARKNANLFGECAQSASGGRACIIGSRIDMARVDLLLLWRNYQKDFQNAHGNGFGQRGDVLNNEQGFYLGWRWTFPRSSKISFYIDSFKFPWSKYLVPMPSSGWEFMSMVEHKLRKGLSLLVRLKIKSLQETDAFADQFGNRMYKMVERQNRALRLQMEFIPEKRIRLRSRLEWNSAHRQFIGEPFTVTPDTAGFMLYQDLHLQPNPSFSLHTRWCFFDAGAYDVRFYQYESDLPGVMRLKLLYGRGSRWYAAVSWEASKWLSFHLKYEHTCYDNKSIIGSGNDMIHSQHENAFSTQFDWRI
jgi:competence ComEA-like helix-hairpin-helix protein